jgi:hypothetical protein
MKRLALLMMALMLVVCTARMAHAQLEGPYVYKSSLRINTYHFLRYWPNPNAKEPTYNFGSWTPKVEFNVQGPLEGGSQVSLTFTKPDGTKWFSVNLETPEIPADQFASFRYDDTSKEKLATILTGTFGLTINLANALTKTNKTLFTGKFDVAKFHYGGNAPDAKNNFDYYVSHDWNLPIAQLVWSEEEDERTPRLRVNMWFRGEKDSTKMAGYLFYKGKQVASTKMNGSAQETVTLRPGTTEPNFYWSRWTLYFTLVSSGLKMESANNYDALYFLDKNPGEYEIKVLYDGKLARTAKFTIGPDGKFVDNGLAEKNKMGKGVILLPATVEAGIDGKADITKYKAQAYYYNPVVGFP